MNDSMVKTFLAIYEAGSITKASENLSQSKTNIRQTLINLEDELGILLFERKNRGLTPTEDSHRMYNILKYLQFNIEELENFYNINKVSTGLKVATNYIEAIASFFTESVEKFGDDNSIYSYKNLNTDEIIDLLVRDKADIGIFCFGANMKSIIDKLCTANNLIYKVLLVTKPAIYVRENHPLSDKEFVTPFDLFPYKRVSLDDSARKVIRYLTNMIKKNIPSNPDITVGSVRNVVKFLDHNNYFYISLDILENKPYIKSLKPLKILDPSLDMYIVYSHKKDYVFNKEGTHFINLLTDYFRGGE